MFNFHNLKKLVASADCSTCLKFEEMGCMRRLGRNFAQVEFFGYYCI